MSLSNLMSRGTSAARSSVLDMASTLGHSVLHALIPDEFEFYACSLELLNSKGDTVAYMMFPVMPNNIMESKADVINIVKTQNAIVTQFNSSFAMRDINIQGTFGKKFRLITGMKSLDKPKKKGTIGLSLGVTMGEASAVVKTGYGMIRVFKDIIDTLYKTDENGLPHVLIFSNHSLGTEYAVEVMNSSFSQSVDNNMIWFYSLDMKAVAPADLVRPTTTAKFLMRANVQSIGRGVENILRKTTKFDLSSMWG